MANANKMIKSTKGKIAISTLALALSLSGCSFHLDKEENQKDKQILIEYDSNKTDMHNHSVDDVFGFSDNSSKDFYGELFDYTYLIDNSEETTATLAHVLDEKTITSKGSMFDKKEEMTSATFNLPIVNPIIVPQIFCVYGMESMSDLVSADGDCDITCKKMLTLDGDTLYYIEGVFTFNDFAKKTGVSAEEGDQIISKTLYELQDNGMWKELYRHQTGPYDGDPYVLENNHNDANEIVIPLSETVFINAVGEQSKDYILEALDTYSGRDNYYSGENEGIDFSQYKK